MKTKKTKESPIATGTVGQKQCRKARHKCRVCIGGCIVIHFEVLDDGMRVRL